MRRMFTLLELLIVIAIIGILVTLLMPSLGKAREKARIAVCQSNLSQIYKACLVYANNHNRKLPPPGNNTGHSGGGSVWAYTLNREVSDELHLYLNSKQTDNTVFDCPSNEASPRGEKTVGSTKLYLMDQYSMLTYFERLTSASLQTNFDSPMFMGEEGVIVSETMIWWKSPSDSTWGSNHGNGQRSNVWTELKLNPDGYNQTFMNGTIKWMNISSLQKASPGAKINTYWLYWIQD